MENYADTIAAIITPPGRGGVAIIRICGKNLDSYFDPLVGNKPSPRNAVFRPFLDANEQELDRGLVLYFPAPGSFTGEETLELHGHGGPVLMDQLLQRVIQLGARQARPGEFSERAFLNGKIDLAQAEAIADLIDATTKQAARGALRTLKGDFSKVIQNLLNGLTLLRVYVEVAIDFPEEEIDFFADGKVNSDLSTLIKQTRTLLNNASQGVLLKEGITVAIAGEPNAGKSSLLNALTGRDRAIVTETPGTTRDVLTEQINIDGLPIHIIDTAGLRESDNQVEQEGIRRAWVEIGEADSVLWVVDSRNINIKKASEINPRDIWPEYHKRYPERNNVTVVINKIDLIDARNKSEELNKDIVWVSALTGHGIGSLRQQLKAIAGYGDQGEGLFTARRRHLEALTSVLASLIQAQQALSDVTQAGELVAEDLRVAQQYLGEITGVVTSNELLGQIFSSFCIGK